MIAVSSPQKARPDENEGIVRSDLVQGCRVAVCDLLTVTLRHPAEHLVDHLLRARPGAVIVRIVRAPHQDVAAGGLQCEYSWPIVLEYALYLAFEEVAGQHVRLDMPFIARTLAYKDMIHPFEEVRHPTAVALHAQQAQLWMALQHAGEDHHGKLALQQAGRDSVVGQKMP